MAEYFSLYFLLDNEDLGKAKSLKVEDHQDGQEPLEPIDCASIQLFREYSDKDFKGPFSLFLKMKTLGKAK